MTWSDFAFRRVRSGSALFAQAYLSITLGIYGKTKRQRR